MTERKVSRHEVFFLGNHQYIFNDTSGTLLVRVIDLDGSVSESETRIYTGEQARGVYDLTKTQRDKLYGLPKKR